MSAIFYFLPMRVTYVSFFPSCNCFRNNFNQIQMHFFLISLVKISFMKTVIISISIEPYSMKQSWNSLVISFIFRLLHDIGNSFKTCLMLSIMKFYFSRINIGLKNACVVILYIGPEEKSTCSFIFRETTIKCIYFQLVLKIVSSLVLN